EPRANSEMRLNSAYTFDNFVVGPSNCLPHAAALAVAESPSQAYNPLFVHASVGMGKTHLVHAICHALLRKRRDLNILYLSCEGFVNQFISAVEHGQIEKFRYRYRHVDVLLVDDIHALQGKERTQEEFFHTFNTLHNDHKQIVLSSDSPPAEIPKLEERLVSRFNWGLVTRIDPPTFETRVAIVNKKAQLRGRQFPSEVVEFIAASVEKNIRELEGAVVTIIGYSSLANKPVSLGLARDALRDTIRHTRNRPGMDAILDAVIQEFHVRLSDLQSKKRSRALAYPRQVCMYLARKLTELSLAEIGGYFGGRDHTTVLHACDKIGHVLASDPERSARIEQISRLLTNGSN
ncbi:chromosomal replication initiator protein DnaA, partial [Candidatus Bipolaricaulota bacterium]|nr:chromosomal replication initiator protein DnaA [Candidatus Bipolaricaulota bacterium]